MNGVYERLSKIFNRLCKGEELKIGQLAKEYGVSTKTIQRDFKERLAGVGLIREGNRFFLNLKKTPKSLFVLEILHNIAKEIGGEFEYEARKVLKSPQGERNIAYPMQNLSPKIPEILTIQKAIKKKTLLRMEYYSQEIKDIQPLDLICYGGMWYLCAQTPLGREYLLLSEIEQCRAGRKNFVLYQEQKRGNQVSLFVYPEAAHELKSLCFAQEQKMIEDRDGSLIIDFDCDDLVGVEREILRWIPYVVVLEPQELKDCVEKRVAHYVQRCEII